MGLWLFFLFLMSAFTAIIEENNSGSRPSVFTFLSIAILALVSGFRYNMGGYDYYIYESLYQDITNESAESLRLAVLDQEIPFEIGYTALIYFCANVLHLSYNGYLVLQSVIFYSLMYIGLRRYMPNWGIFLMFFLYKMFFFYTFVVMRQALTIAGFYSLLPFLQRREAIKYYLFLAVISLFHSGAWILFLLYPLFGISLSKKRVIILSLVFGALTPLAFYTSDVLSRLVSYAGIASMEAKADFYSSTTYTISPFYLVEYYLLIFLFIKYYETLKLTYVHFEFFMKMFLMVLPIITIFRSNDVLIREISYFYPSYVILFCYVCSLMKKRDACFFMNIFSLMCLAGMIKKIIVDWELKQYHGWLFNPDIHFFQI